MSSTPTRKAEILSAAHTGNLTALKQLHIDHPQIDLNTICYDTTGESILHIVARLGYVEMLQYLLNKGMDVNIRTKEDKTPLHEASQFGQAPIVDNLLTRMADVNALKRSDWTPLMLACTKIKDSQHEIDHLYTVTLLLRHGALVNYANKDKWTALHLIVREGSLRILQLLHIHQIDLHAVTRNGRTALHIASLHGHLDIVRFLLENNLAVDQRDNCGNTAVMDAASAGHTAICQLCHQAYNANLTAINNEGFNALHLGASQGHLATISYLIQEGVGVNARSRLGLTPLHCARKHKEMKAAQLLIQLGANVILKDHFDRAY